MIKLLRNRSDFIRNSATLISGTAIAQAISLIVSPVITRLYTPAAFGTFTFLISVIVGFGWIATLRYPISLTPLIIRKTRQMFWLSLTGAACMLITITAGALFYHDVMTVFILLSALMSCYSIGVIWWILMKVKLSR